MTRTSFGKNNLVGVAIVFGLILSSLGFSSVAKAQSGSIGGRPASPDPQNSRTKSIFINELSQGESANDQLLLINNSDETKQVLVYAVDAAPSSDGAFACAQAADTPKKVGKWVTFTESEVVLAAKETRKIDFTITADKTAEPGEQNGCIVMQEKKSPTFQGGIGLSFRTAIRLSVLVPGDIIKKLSADSVATSLTDDSLIITPTVNNTGTVSLDTTVKVKLLSVFGTTVHSRSSTFPVLRDQPTSWNFEFKRPFWGGYYRANYTLTHDNSSNGLLGAETEKGSSKTIQGPSRWTFVPPHPAALIIELLVLAGVFYPAVVLVKKYYHKKQIAGSWEKYIVKDGDQIKPLAEEHGLSWKELAAANHLKAPYNLNPGKSIIVPPKAKPKVKR